MNHALAIKTSLVSDKFLTKIEGVVLTPVNALQQDEDSTFLPPGSVYAIKCLVDEIESRLDLSVELKENFKAWGKDAAKELLYRIEEKEKQSGAVLTSMIDKEEQDQELEEN